MTKAEIIVIILIGLILLFVGVTYFFHGRKIEKKNKSEKQKSKKEEIKQEEKIQPEQKPVPVGIIKEEKPKPVDASLNSEYDLAPFKDKPKETSVDKTNDNKKIQDEIKNLSPEMKKILVSDILKPKF